jgi:hypothetical protein
MHGLLRLLKWRDYRARARAFANLVPASPLAPIPEADGFRWVDDINPKVIAAALAAGQKFMADIDFAAAQAKSKSKHLISLPVPTGRPDEPILALALDPALVKMVGEYIGTLPLLMDIILMYSPNASDIPATSQHYHLDAQDIRTIIVYLFLHDVDKDGGPFVALTAAASERCARLMNYKKVGENRRVSDAFVNAHIRPDEKHIFTGPAGSLFVCDTDRCFHYGSRCAARPRFVIAFHYVSPASFSIPWRYHGRLPHASPATFGELEDWQRMVLGGPVKKAC